MQQLKIYTAASLLFATLSLQAQDEDIDTVFVTGARTPVARVTLGSATSVITREQIEHRQARYVSDLLRGVPGFAVSHTGTFGSQTQVRVRGTEANHVLVLIDGIRANDPATGDEFRWEQLSTANIERIEIARGAQSSLWGSDAVGAVVHIITRNGSQSPGFGGFAETGSFGTLNAGVNGGFAGDDWSIGLGFEQLDTDGTNVSRSGAEDDESDMSTLSVNSRWQASERTTIVAGVRAVDAFSQFDPVDFAVTGLPVDGDVATESTQLYGNLGLSVRGDRITHHINVRYFDSDNENLTDGTVGSSSAADRTTFGYQADVSLGDDVLVLAAEYEDTGFKQRGEVVFGDPNQNQSMDVTSFIAEYRTLLGDAVNVLVSARYDNYSDFDDALTGRVSVSWQAGESTRLRANIGTGQKTPTFTERFGFFPGQFIGNPNLDPESSTSFDIGIEQQFLNDALTLDLSMFLQDLDDEINGFVFDPATFLSTAENIDGTSRRSGVETGLTYALSDNLELRATYTYLDATEEDDNGGDVIEIRRPRHSGSIHADYRFMADRGSILLAADYGGSRNDLFFAPFPEPVQTVTLSNYWLVDLTIGFDVTDNFNLFVRGSNLLDEDYEQVFGYATPGVAGYIGARLNFGQRR